MLLTTQTCSHLRGELRATLGKLLTRAVVPRATRPVVFWCRCCASSSAAGAFDTSTTQPAWDFGKRGGSYPLQDADDAEKFFDEQGFVVFTDVMSDAENTAATGALLEDLHEVNPAKAHISALDAFEEDDLPTSPNHTFRTTCNMAFGRFSWAVRTHYGVKEAFAKIHGTTADSLSCSWDNPFYTPQATDSCSTQSACTQLHWDMNYFFKGTKAPLTDELCVQGVYYATETSETTPTFVCCPGSHKEAFMAYCQADTNPSGPKHRKAILNYLPIDVVGGVEFASKAGLAPPVRIHVPSKALLLWNSRTCHGNSAPVPVRGQNGDECERRMNASGGFEAEEGNIGRVAFAICYGPTSQRTAAVHKAGLLMGLAGMRTTHNPAIMLAHDKHGYPPDFVSNAEPNSKLNEITLGMNPEVTEEEFQSMLDRAGLSVHERQGLSLTTVQRKVFDSYWKVDGATEADAYAPMLKLSVQDLRRLLPTVASSTQGTHECEL